jgi:hypothetical protein
MPINLSTTSEFSSFFDDNVPECEPSLLNLLVGLHARKMRETSVPQSLEKATPSAFAGWVYSLYNKPHMGIRPADINGSQARLNKDDRHVLGVLTQEWVDQFFQWINLRNPGAMGTGWDWIYGKPGHETEILEASRLRVGGEALRCKPDAVLRHRATGDIIIIERKAAFVPLEKIPAVGWPNIKAQLWCYSWLDQWQDARKIYLVGQIWHVVPIWGRKAPFPAKQKLVGLERPRLTAAYLRWNKDDQLFQDQCRELFQYYGGEVVGMTQFDLDAIGFRRMQQSVFGADTTGDFS